MYGKYLFSATAILSLLTACSDPPSEKPKTKPTHVWSSQVESLYQAKEVAKFVDEQEKLNQQRLNELGVGSRSTPER